MTSVVVAVLTAVVLSAGLAAAAVVQEAPPTSTGAAGTLGLSQLSGAQTADENVPAPSPAAPPTETAIGPTSAPPLPGHRTTGAVVTPFQAGRSEWSGVSNGITLHLVLATPSPRAGDSVTFVAEASMAGALCCNLTLQFGDGGGGLYPPAPGLGQNTCTAQEPKSGSVRGELHHAYNKGGRWNFSLSARAGGTCDGSGGLYGSLDGTLEIGGGGSSVPSAQGPSLPSVRPASSAPYERYVMTLIAEAKDDDGYIDRLIVDWGDGTSAASYPNPRPCTTTASGWPEAGYTMLPLWMGVGPVTHRYRDDGPYKVTVTVVSTGCDRTGEQRASATLTFPEQLPPPPPIESIPLPSHSQLVPPPPIPSIPVPPPGPPPSLPFTTTTTTAPATTGG